LQELPICRRWPIGKSVLSGAFLLLVLGIHSPATAATTTADFHTFTNSDGNSFKAQVTALTNDDVTLKREDGQVFHPKISIFNKADQIYIRLWAAKNAPTHDKGIFEFQAVSVEGIITKSLPDSASLALAAKMQYGAGNLTLSTWDENYQVKAKNLTLVNWGSLHFRYSVFKLSVNPGKLPPNDFTPMRVLGTFDMDKCSNDEEKSFLTDKIPMRGYHFVFYDQAFDNNNQTIYNNYRTVDIADKFQAIWIRVYDDDENLLQEWASDPDIIKTQPWIFPQPGAQGGANPNAAPGPRLPTPPRP